MSKLFESRPIKNAIVYFLSAFFLSRLAAVLIVYPLAEVFLSPSTSLNKIPPVSLATLAVNGFLFAWASLFFLSPDKPKLRDNCLYIALAIIFFSGFGVAADSVNSTTADADMYKFTSALITTATFFVPYLVGNAIFKRKFAKLQM